VGIGINVTLMLSSHILLIRWVLVFAIRDDHGRFVLARLEWITPITDVEVGEAIGLLHALRWADELQIRDMEFEVDCKRVVDSLYNNKNYASDLGAIIEIVEVY
jgi:hypothetical protein